MKNIFTLLIAGTFLLALSQCKPKAENNTESAPAKAGPELSQADSKEITNKEIATWEFAKTKQLDKLGEIMADDYQAFFGTILMNKAEVLQSFQQSKITNYRLMNIRLKKINDGAAVIYFDALQNATDPDGDRWVPKIAGSTIYVKRGGSWYSLFYHETPMMQ